MNIQSPDGKERKLWFQNVLYVPELSYTYLVFQKQWRTIFHQFLQTTSIQMPIASMSQLFFGPLLTALNGIDLLTNSL